MLTNFVVQLVDISRRFAVLVVLAALVASAGMGSYVVTHFKMNTDVNQLLADDLDWRKREVELEKAFPQKVDRLVVVIDGDTPDAAEAAAAALTKKLQEKPDLFKNVVRPDAIPFSEERFAFSSRPMNSTAFWKSSCKLSLCLVRWQKTPLCADCSPRSSSSSRASSAAMPITRHSISLFLYWPQR